MENREREREKERKGIFLGLIGLNHKMTHAFVVVHHQRHYIFSCLLFHFYLLKMFPIIGGTPMLFPHVKYQPLEEVRLIIFMCYLGGKGLQEILEYYEMHYVVKTNLKFQLVIFLGNIFFLFFYV